LLVGAYFGIDPRPPAINNAAVAEQVLNMVAHFVSYDVGLRELSFRAAKSPLQFIEEGWIQINGFVRRAVEGTYSRRRSAAASLDLTREKDHVGIFIGLPGFLELLIPHFFGEAEDCSRELTTLCLFGSERPLVLAVASAAGYWGIADELVKLLPTMAAIFPSTRTS